VTDDEGALFPASADEIGDVLHEEACAVGGDALGLAREVVAAHVRGDDAIACLSERGDLLAPRVPELREAVEEDDQRACAGLDVVEADAGELGVAVVEGDGVVAEGGGVGGHEGGDAMAFDEVALRDGRCAVILLICPLFTSSTPSTAVLDVLR
jgi:hypothetical protein